MKKKKEKRMKIEKEDKSEYENLKSICCPFLKSTKCN